MQIKGKYSWVKHLDFMLIDLGALLLSFLFSYFFKFKILVMDTGWKRFIVIISLINVVIDLLVNPYSGIFRRRYYQEIGRGFLIVVGNAISVTLIFYLLKIGAEYSREVIVYTYIFYFVIGVVAKYCWKKLLTKGKVSFNNAKRISLFLISDKESADKDVHSVYATDLPLYEIKGIHFISDNNNDATPETVSYQDGIKKEDIPVIKDDYMKFIFDNNINEVLVATKTSDIGTSVYKELVDNGVGVSFVVEPLLGFQTEEEYVTNIGINKSLSVGSFSFSPSQSSYLVIKRLFDIICGLFGVAILIPITFIVKIAYLVSGDTAKIFYRQKRVGLNGKIIKIWKFRSMVPDAGEILKELLKDKKYRKEWEENQKIENDPRITKVGSILRKTSIDELPQLLNVLVGDMSLVGPRPLVEGELAAHNGLKLYEKVKPGITGWWGCNGRSNIDYRERLELEYFYVKNCSLYLDILCIIRTVFAVLKKDGAQ